MILAIVILIAAAIIAVAIVYSGMSRKNNQTDYIGEQRAQEIALADAGISADETAYITAHMDYENGIAVYEVNFVSGDPAYEYDYELRATDGYILKRDIDLEDDIPLVPRKEILTRSKFRLGRVQEIQGCQTMRIISEKTKPRKLHLQMPELTKAKRHLQNSSWIMIMELPNMKSNFYQAEWNMNTK